MPASPAVLLIGMMGVGKTTVGRALSARLECPYLDSDEQVARATGRSVPEILESDGEAAFRIEEKRALADALADDGPRVVSVAGGAVLDPDNRRRLQGGGVVVWLRAEVATMAVRVGSGEGRPLLGDDPPAALARLYEERRPLYAELADIVIDVDDVSAEQVADRIVEELSCRA